MIHVVNTHTQTGDAHTQIGDTRDTYRPKVVLIIGTRQYEYM